MPDLNKLGVPEYAPEQPYHYDYDNLPLKILAERDILINNAVDTMTTILNDSAGSTASLSDRLDVSLNPDGTISTVSFDDSMHNIASHSDGYNSTVVGAGTITVSGGELAAYQALGFPSLTSPVSFVRMLDAERNKLALVASQATKLFVEFPSGPVFGTDGNPTLSIVDSATITWTWDGSQMMADAPAFANAHQHYYDVKPHDTGDYQNYQTNISSSPYTDGSLRVYINGIKLTNLSLFPNKTIYVPSATASPDGVAWTANGYYADAMDASNGVFSLYTPITINDRIRIDYDVSL